MSKQLPFEAFSLTGDSLEVGNRVVTVYNRGSEVDQKHALSVTLSLDVMRRLHAWLGRELGESDG